MTALMKKRAGAIKKLSLVVMLAAPFGLYLAAQAGSSSWLYLLLGVMGLSMLANLLLD
ncbi:MAG: hypothetical protein AB1814_09370 [Thermodesulfobacteriota bacterium]